MAAGKPTDPEIPALTALRAGDQQAWTAFFARFDVTIRAIVAWPRWHFDPHTCADVAQTIRVGIVQSIERLQAEQALPSFVRRICVNRCIDMLRSRLREGNRLVPLGRRNDDGDWEDLDVADDREFDPATVLLRAERATCLRAAMSQLDAPSQDYLRQFYVDGLSYREMAQRQGVAVNTVGSRLSRCLDKLRDVLIQTEART